MRYLIFVRIPLCKHLSAEADNTASGILNRYIHSLRFCISLRITPNYCTINRARGFFGIFKMREIKQVIICTIKCH